MQRYNYKSVSKQGHTFIVITGKCHPCPIVTAYMEKFLGVSPSRMKFCPCQGMLGNGKSISIDGQTEKEFITTFAIDFPDLENFRPLQTLFMLDKLYFT